MFKIDGINGTPNAIGLFLLPQCLVGGLILLLLFCDTSFDDGNIDGTLLEDVIVVLLLLL